MTSNAHLSDSKSIGNYIVGLCYLGHLGELCPRLLPPGLPMSSQEADYLHLRVRAVQRRDWHFASGPSHIVYSLLALLQRPQAGYH